MKKSIVFIIPLYSSYHVFLNDLCKKLIAKNWKVYVFTKLPDKIDLKRDGIDFIDIELPRKYQIFKYVKAAKKIRSEIKKIKPNCVHAHFSATAPVIKLSRINSFTNCFITVHGLICGTKSKDLVYHIIKKIEIFLYKDFKKVWVLTHSDFEILKSEIPQLLVYPSKGLGCDLEIFNPDLFNRQTKELLKASLKINKNDFVFIFVGRLTNFKGFDITYKAFQKINSEFENTKLLVLGDFDPIHHSGLSNKELIEYNNDKSVLKIGMTSQVNQYLSIANVLVFPSFKEGMPVNLMESIAMGVPIITYNARGNKDIIINHHNGWLLNERTINAFYMQMKKIILNEDLLLNITKNQLLERHLFNRNAYVDYQIKSYETP